MDPTATTRRTRKISPKPDLYSTVVVHGDDESNSESDRDQKQRRGKPKSSDQEPDPYATFVYKNNAQEEEDEDDDSSLPPLLKRLPKDFGGGASLNYFDDEEENGGDFGTMIVKSVRNRTTRRSRDWGSRAEDDGGDGDAFSTFVMRPSDRESLTGTVRRTSGGGSTMSIAVASMQASGDGFGKQRKGSASSQNNEEARHNMKMSSSSIPESVTREDPTTKYELLNELGRFVLVQLQSV